MKKNLVFCFVVALGLIITPSIGFTRDQGVFVYSAEGWKLKITDTDVTYSRRLGSYKEEWKGSRFAFAPPTDDGSFVGTFIKTYVVAGCAEDRELPFKLELKNQPCTDHSGRTKPITAILTLNPEEASASHEIGCGSRMLSNFYENDR